MNNDVIGPSSESRLSRCIENHFYILIKHSHLKCLEFRKLAICSVTTKIVFFRHLHKGPNAELAVKNKKQ